MEDNHHKPLDACNLSLWKVGRATGAASTYFSPYRIGKDIYRDAGTRGANNPVKFAYKEVRQMHSRHYPKLIISIGTGKQRERTYEQKRGIVAFLVDPTGVLSDLENDFKQSMNAEEQHEEFQEVIERDNTAIKHKSTEAIRKAKQNDDAELNTKSNKTLKSEQAELITYVRFNVPLSHHEDGSDLSQVKLGDWHGENGWKTKQIMDSAVDRYLESEQDKLDRCADILVNTRHERQTTVRWESFALHIAYGCPLTCQELELESRVGLREHLIRDHGYVWQVPCVDHRGQNIKPWSCFWDECGEEVVSVFDSKEEFTEHLKHKHKKERPIIVDHEKLERLLDKGRKLKQPQSVSPTNTFRSQRQSGLSHRQTGFSQLLPSRRTNTFPR